MARREPRIESETVESAGTNALGATTREAAQRRRTRSAIREEVRQVAIDEADREEMRIIREQMSELAAADPC